MQNTLLAQPISETTQHASVRDCQVPVRFDYQGTYYIFTTSPAVKAAEWSTKTRRRAAKQQNRGRENCTSIGCSSADRTDLGLV